MFKELFYNWENFFPVIGSDSMQIYHCVVPENIHTPIESFFSSLTPTLQEIEIVEEGGGASWYSPPAPRTSIIFLLRSPYPWKFHIHK